MSLYSDLMEIINDQEIKKQIEKKYINSSINYTRPYCYKSKKKKKTM